MCVPGGPNSRLVQLNMLHCCQDDHSTLGAGLTAQMGPPMVILPTVGLSVLRLSPCEYCKCAILGLLFILYKCICLVFTGIHGKEHFLCKHSGFL